MDGRKARDGEYIDKVGHYNPTCQPEEIVHRRSKGEGLAVQGCSAHGNGENAAHPSGDHRKVRKTFRSQNQDEKEEVILTGGAENVRTRKYVVEQFAEYKDQIEYRVEEKDNATEIVVLLEESDMGKVIGKQGKIAKALRTLVRCASAKEGKKYNIEIKKRKRRPNNRSIFKSKREKSSQGFSLFFSEELCRIKSSSARS